MQDQRKNHHFERVWSAYPKKENKQLAQFFFEKATSEMSIDELNDFTDKLVRAIDAQIRARWNTKEKQYIPLLHNWIKDCGWLKEIKSATETKTSNQTLCECGKPTFNNKVCQRCYTKLTAPNLKQDMKSTLDKYGIKKKDGETWREACLRGLEKNNVRVPDVIGKTMKEEG